MARLHPGVYVEEVSSGVRPIEGVSTSTAAFVGKTEMGTLNTAVLATSMEEFTASHGGFLNDSYLAHAVLYFFTNGGNACYLARIAGSGAAAASIALRNRKTAAARTLIVRASSEGKWGNRIDVSVADGTVDPDN